MSIMQAIFGIINSILSIFKSKESRKEAEEKKKNEAPFVKAEEKKREVERIDSHEKLVKDVSDPIKKQEALDEIRRRLGK